MAHVLATLSVSSERQVVTAGKGCEIFKAGDVRQSVSVCSNTADSRDKQGGVRFLLAINSQKNKMSLANADYAELLRKYERKPLTTSLEQPLELRHRKLGMAYTVF